MEVYLGLLGVLTLIFIFGFGLIPKQKTEGHQHIWLILGTLVLWLIAALRSKTVGADTTVYVSIFEQAKSWSLDQVLRGEYLTLDGRKGYLELGYAFFNKICSTISDHPQMIIIASSALCIYLLYLLIKRDSPFPLLSLWLYVTLGIYQTQLNMSRNAIALWIVYLAFRYIKEYRFTRYLLFLLLATSIHNSAILLLPIYWLVQRVQLSKKRILLVLGLSSAVGFLVNVITLISPFVPARYTEYLLDTEPAGIKIVLGCFYLALAVICLYFRQGDAERFYQRNNLGLWMLLLNFAFFALGIQLPVFYRVAALFGPYLVVSIPQMIADGAMSINKRRYLIVLLLLITGVQYALRLSFNNIGKTMPYATFWSTSIY